MLFRLLTLLFLLPCLASAQEIFQPEKIKGIPESALFVDLRLKIESANCPSWNQCKVHASGTRNGRHVSLEIQIREGSKTDEFLKITYISVGAASDELLAAIAELYRLPLSKSRFSQGVVADLVPLQATKDELGGKIFFYASGPESRYAELYTDIDLKKGTLWIKEKDPEYRENVLRAFSE